MKRPNGRKWEITPLHNFLVRILPNYVYDDGTLAIPELAFDLKMSREGFYKWMRTGKLSKGGMVRLYAFAQQHSPNPPKIEEFTQFLVA